MFQILFTLQNQIQRASHSMSINKGFKRPHNFKQPKKSQGKTTLLFILIAVIAVGIGVFVQTSTTPSKPVPEFSKTILLPQPKDLSDAAFTDHTGKPYGLAQMQGKWNILFFGFTNCPDICPSTMQTLKQVKQKVSDAGLWNNYQVIMVSVDPERDSTETLSKYVPYFDSSFTGIVSDVETTAAFAKQLGILFVKRDPDETGFYDVDHSASIILINPQGQWAGAITAPHKADEISQDLIKLAKYTGETNTQTTTNDSTHSTNANTSNKEAVQDSTNDLSIEQAWIRPAPPSATAMAAYFVIKNNTDNDIVVKDSASELFDMVMIHNTEIENGIAKMVHMDSLTVPAKGQATLAPMSTHMMLMRPSISLKEGDLVDIELIDSNNTHYQYQIEVRQPPVQ